MKSSKGRPLEKPRIAVFAGPQATILNTPPLVTSNSVRQAHGLPLLTDEDGIPPRFDALRPQRLAAPVTVYIEQFSAHPLERDAAALYGPPDGYVDAAGTFSPDRRSPADKPVYAVTLRPEDGLYPLPYAALQADGRAWDGAGTSDDSDLRDTRQTMLPDASRLLEEIDRLAIDRYTGRAGLVSSSATLEYFRAAPPGGWMTGEETGGERPGIDFFAYAPPHLRTDPPLKTLAVITNEVTRVVETGDYDAVLWLEGSPTVEETLYWLHLVLDTSRPIVAHSAQRAHGSVGSDGPRNVLKGIRYVRSGAWADVEGRDSVGGVLIVDDLIYCARDVQKADARTGGYTTTGGLGGPLGTVTDRTPVTIAFRPTRWHTHRSDVNLTRLPVVTRGVRRSGGAIEAFDVRIKDEVGRLLPDHLPVVEILKYSSYRSREGAAFGDPEEEIEIRSCVERNLRNEPLSGFVCEAMAPYGTGNRSMDAALREAVYSGLPVVKVGRGNTGGIVPSEGDVFILGSNLTATKARLLLMLALMRLGALTPTRDPRAPTREELATLRSELSRYQEIFDTH